MSQLQLHIIILSAHISLFLAVCIYWGYLKLAVWGSIGIEHPYIKELRLSGTGHPKNLQDKLLHLGCWLWHERTSYTLLLGVATRTHQLVVPATINSCRHNDLTAKLMTEVCHNICLEPPLQSLKAETFWQVFLKMTLHFKFASLLWLSQFTLSHSQSHRNRA